MNRLRIEQHGLDPRKARFWLNDQEVVGLREVRVSWGLADITTAEIAFAVDWLEIDADTMASLRAIEQERPPS